MRDSIQYLLAIVSVGAAIYLAYHQYPILYVAIFLLFAMILIKNVRSIHAKSGDTEFSAQFGEENKARIVERGDEEATKRLSQTSESRTLLGSDDQDDEEVEASAL